MRNIVLSLVFLLFTICLFGQNIPAQEPNITDENGLRQGEWVIWYDSEWKVTNIKDSVSYYRIITFTNDIPDGKVHDYYRSGSIQWEGFLKSTDPDVNNGLLIYYYESGIIQTKYSTSDGEIEGEYISYYENGQVKRMCYYKNGVEDGKVEAFYEDGQKQVQGQYSEGERIKLWTWFNEDGTVKSTNKYLKKELVARINTAKELYNNQRYEHAALEFEAVLPDLEAEYGANDTAFYTYYIILTASSFDKSEQYNQAENYYLKAKSIYENINGTTAPYYNIIINNLAVLYSKTEQVDKALALYRNGKENKKNSGNKDKSTNNHDVELIIPSNHSASITAICFSPNGENFITASWDGTVKIWITKTGELLNTLTGHSGGINGAIYSPDGAMILTYGVDRRTIIWDANSGNILQSVLYEHSIQDAAWSPNGKMFASATGEYTTKVFDSKSGKVISTLSSHNSWLTSISWSPDSKRIATVSADKTAKIWVLESGSLLYTLKIENSTINNAIWSPSGKYIATCIQNDSIKIWNSINGELINTIPGQSKNKDDIWSDKGRKTFSSSKDIVGLWEVSNWNVKEDLWSSDSKYILTYSNDSIANVWDIHNRKLVSGFNHGESIIKTIWSPDDNYIITLSKNKNAKIWDLSSGGVLFELDTVYSIDWSLDNNHIITRYLYDKTVKLWNNKGEQLYCIQGENEFSTALYSPNFSKIASTSYNSNTINIWDIYSGTIAYVLKGHNDEITSLIWSKNGKYVISGSKDNSIIIWDIRSGCIKHKLESHSGEINSLCLSPLGNFFLSSSCDSRVRVWDIESGKNLKTFIGHKSSVKDARWSFDENKIVSISEDNEVIIWNANTQLLEFRINLSESLNNIEVSKSENYFISTNNWTQLATVWNIATGEKMQEFDWVTPVIPEVCYIPKVTWSNNGRGIAFSSCDGIVKILDLKTNKISVFAGYEDVNWINDGQHIIVSNNNNEQYKIYDAYSQELIEDFDISSFYYQGFDVENSTLLSQKNNQLMLYNIYEGEKIRFVTFDTDNFITITPDNYYSAQKYAAQKLSFKYNNDLYSFEQFDLKYNRPDIVLERIGYASDTLIEAYHQAYLRRLNKMGFTEEQLSGEFHIPETKIENYDDLPYMVNEANDEVSLQLSFSDSAEILNRYNIWVNDVPLYGMTGKSIISKNTKSFSTTAKVPLSKGENRIQVSCLNNAGAESYKETYYVNYAPPVSKKPELHLIAIAVSEYQSLDDLQYAETDAKSIVAQFSNSTLYSSISIDTLYGDDVTNSNIKSLKDDLFESNLDDHVIVFYSGHGLLDKEYNYYLGTNSIDPQNPSESGIAYNTLEWLIDSIPARNKLLLLDACHSGEVDKELKNYTLQTDTVEAEIELSMDYNNDVASVEQQHKGNLPPTTSYLGLQQSFELMKDLFADIDKSTGAIVISAAGGLDAAFESTPWGHGAFTYCLLNAFTDEALIEDGKITISELKDYINIEVEKLTNGRQKPTTRTENLVNDFVIWE